mmetsp:Transcript_7300/g.6387  ORF Transcript_7300/g.6387 Transcript_7300/m.6387 type:complete len:123 (-) Transcript_7300:646-1014(-)
MKNYSIKIGWIGTGVMGKSMAGHLINKGYSLLVNNRTKSKADDLVQLGATYCEDPLDVARDADYVFMMLGFPKDVETMVFGGEDGNSGLLSVMKKGAHLIDHTTSSPGLAQRIAKKAIKKGV